MVDAGKSVWRTIALFVGTFILIFSCWIVFGMAYYIPLTPPGLAIRRDAVREAMLGAWYAYKKYAWGHDFLKPQTLEGSDVFGLGVTIIDSLDTLLLMNLTKEFEDARQWVQTSLKMTEVVSFFETVIRGVGGLISAYEMTGDFIFLEKAKELGDRLMPAFNTPTNLPRALVNLGTGDTSDHSWANESILLADAGSCQLEFAALTEHTGDMKYTQAAQEASRQLRKIGPVPPTHIYRDSLWPSVWRYSLDAFGDSYFEYLLKMNLYAPKNVSYPDEFRDAVVAMCRRLGFTGIKSGATYFASIQGEDIYHEMSHLSFFLPGMMFLAADNDTEHRESYLELAEELLDAGIRLYRQNEVKLGGENVRFVAHGKGAIWVDDTFKLRPELVESLFYGWRFTHKRKYRRVAWDIFKAINKYCKVGDGYTTVHDTTQSIVVYENLQESFFLSETLKYLYLIFCDDDVLDLHDYVFTTQAHPLRKLRY